MKKVVLMSLGLLFLTGCAGTSMLAPKASKAEIEQEQAIQSGLAARAKGKGDREAAATPAHMARLKRIAPVVERGGVRVCQAMHGANAACRFNFVLLKKGPINAFADGKQIVVSPAMMDFASNDNDLAIVLGHEYAHNILQHPQKQQQNASIGGILGTLADSALSSQGISTGGALSNVGTQTAVLQYSQAFEGEADYVGMYVIANAGIPTEKAPDFWRRFAAEMPDSIYVGTTHPTSAERFVALEKTMLEIKFKQQNKQALLPNLKPKS